MTDIYQWKCYLKAVGCNVVGRMKGGVLRWR
jgi:hypothetical protein